MRKHIVITALFAITLTACGSSTTSDSNALVLSDTTMPLAEDAEIDTPATMVVAPTDAVINADGSVSIDVKVGIDDYDTLAGERVIKVALGSTVTITLTDAREDQDYHLHVYDVGAEAKKGEPGVISLIVDQAGQFDLESHMTGKTLLVLVVG
jgi:hypothetical protein